MSDEIDIIIAAAIGDHDYSTTAIGRCVCGVKTKDLPAHRSERVVAALAASGHTIVHSPMTTAFRDATRDLIGKEAWVYGMSEGELRDIVTRAVIAAASAEEGDAVAQASRQECQNDNHDPGCGCGARHWMTAATPAAEEDPNA